MTVLVTGGAGYIGSHMLVELLEDGRQVVVLDSLVNASPEALRRVERITGKPVAFVQGDVRTPGVLERIFAEHAIEAVIHFAGLKAVGESVAQPLAYYDANVGGTLRLCEAMGRAGVFRLVFSSSATVYGDPAEVPIREDAPTGEPVNPYGRSKLFVEQILRDLAASDPRWSIALLRYFNPVGAHPSGLIGEAPSGIPNNLMPYIYQVASGRREQLSVFGGDYPTPDGTGVRDYIHVMDLVRGHLKALRWMETVPLSEPGQRVAERGRGVGVWNLGTGRGYSVLEIVHAFEAASGCRVPYAITDRRPGDVAACWDDPTKAEAELGWRAERGLEAMMVDGWNWHRHNPNGYEPVAAAHEAVPAKDAQA